MKIPSAAIGAIEVALNRYLSEDPGALQQCAELDGKQLVIAITEPAFELVFVPHAGGIQVLSDDDGSPDARLSGSLASFSRLALGQLDAAEAVLGQAVSIEGDPALAESFANILREAQVDPEAILSDYIGDVAAHTVGRFARGLLRWGKQTSQQLSMEVVHQMQAGDSAFVSSYEADAWIREVDRLRDDVERAEARINKLASQMEAQT